MIEEARKAILESSEHSSVYIGCDSIRYKRGDGWWASYCVVVILHRDSKHGGRIFSQTSKLKDYGNIKQRLLTEVQLAIDVALEIADVIGDRHFEIHLDLNADAKHKSNVAMKEALAWVRGSTGVQAKIKPEAFAATHAADHLVRR